MNAAAAASPALALKSPATMESIVRNAKVVSTLLLTRGKTRYVAMLLWKQGNPEPDLAGCQNSNLSRALILRGGAMAVPEKSPAKLMTFNRSVKFWPVI